MMGGDKRGAINAILGPDPKDEKDEGEHEDASLHACVGEFIDAVHAKDIPAAASALKACYADLEASEPEEE